MDHYHELSETDQGVRITDLVHQDIPFGYIGRLIHWLFIKRTLEQIFDRRETKLAEIFIR